MCRDLSRRDFFRVVGWAAVAVVAGTPILAAWARAVERYERHQLIIAQLRYETRRAIEALSHKIALQMYGVSDDDYMVIANDHHSVAYQRVARSRVSTSYVGELFKLPYVQVRA